MIEKTHLCFPWGNNSNELGDFEVTFVLDEVDLPNFRELGVFCDDETRSVHSRVLNRKQNLL